MTRYPQHHGYQVVVVGAGLVGAAVAHELVSHGIRTLVLEACREPAAGASRSNSGIVHTGFDSVPGAFETAMIREHSRRWPSLFAALGIRYRVPGALMLAIDDDEASVLSAVAERGRQNGVAVQQLEPPQVSELGDFGPAKAALLIRGEAITDPYEVVCRLLSTGSDVWLGWPARTVVPEHGGARVEGPQGSVACDFVVNCAGLYADELTGDESLQISPRRGDFVVFGKGTAGLAPHILLPVPSERGKGILVFPTVYGHLCAGPSAIDQEDKEDWRPRRAELDRIVAIATRTCPALAGYQPVSSWAGLRPVGKPHDYFVAWSKRVSGLLHVAAIRSTGLSSCLGLAQHVRGALQERGLAGKTIAGDVGGHPPAQLPSHAAPSKPWWERLNAMRNVTGPC